ncbi:MAG TPA: hypothetical protein VL523_01370 [Terriglobia bacterium]|nr:hypothetical protein [Terriglobia bacterium]
MDVEKTMHFILEQQGVFATHLEAERAVRLEADRVLGERLDALTSAVAALVLRAQAHQASLENFDAKWRDFLDRFDRYLRGQGGGNGNA